MLGLFTLRFQMDPGGIEPPISSTSKKRRATRPRVLNSISPITFKKLVLSLLITMKIPKLRKRYCPYCRKITEQKASLVSTGGKRGALKRGSLTRAKLRNAFPGKGNRGRYGSKPAVSKWNRKTKATKRLVIMFTCQSCKKSKPIPKGIRASKIQII